MREQMEDITYERYQRGSEVAANPKDYEPSSARILDQLDFMAEQISRVFASFDNLHSRLEGILIPTFPSENDVMATAKPTTQSSSIVSDLIDQYNGRLSNLQNQINALAERVQL